MRPFSSFCLLLLLFSPVVAEQPDKARVLLEQAIQAAGGPEHLSKAIAFKLKGTFSGLGQAIPYVGEFAEQPPQRARQKIEAQVQGQKLIMTQVIDGKKGWRRINDDVLDLTETEVKEGQESLYTDWVGTLVPLRDAAFKLSLVEEARIGDLDCVGLKVEREGHRAQVLYFDKVKLLLRRQDTRVKDAAGKELAQETFLEEYQAVDGVQRPTRIRIKRDGKDYLDSTLTEQRFLDKLDEALFQR